MTDIELMLLAAKAAGIRLEWIGDTAFDCTNLKPGKPASKGKMWWPLVDDGDALRLAVKLRINIDHNHAADQQRWVAADRNGCEGCYAPVSCVEDDFEESERATATRRAIVRAAAEIGKAVQKPLAP